MWSQNNAFRKKHFDYILSLDSQLCINFPQILQVPFDSFEVAFEISRAMVQVTPGMLNKLNFFSFFFRRESRVGVGEVFGAGGYYINNDYNLGLKKKPNNFVKGWTKIRFKMWLMKKKRPRQSVPNSWRKVEIINWMKKGGNGKKLEETQRNWETEEKTRPKDKTMAYLFLLCWFFKNPFDLILAKSFFNILYCGLVIG